jgi:hypothetical protein
MADQFELLKLTLQPTGLYTQTVVGAISASSGITDAGKVIITNSAGQVDSSIIPPTGSVNFSGVQTGTNTASHMTVSGSAILDYTSTGVVNANEVGGINVAGNAPAHEGQLLISQPGNTTAVWADPLVQGTQAAGTSASTVNPVLIAGVYSGNLKNLALDASGNPTVNIAGTPIAVNATLSAETTKVIGTVNQGTSPWVISGTTTVSGTVTADQGTSPWVVSGTVTTSPPSHASTNVDEWAGNAVDTNSGSKSAGTLRVVIATDQPQLSNKLLVTADAITFASAQPVTLTSTTISSGTVTANQGTASVGAKWSVQVDNASAIPVSLASLPSLASGSALVGGVEIYDGAGTNKLAVNASGQITISNSSFDVGTVTTLPAVSIAASQTIAVTNIGTFAVQAACSGTVSADIQGHGGVALDAVLGATKPANVLQVGGNDGTNAFAIPLASGGTSVVISGSVTTSGTATVSGTVTANTNADTTINGTSAPSKMLLIGGKSADGTPVYNPIPLAAGSGSVVVSGAVTTTGTATVSGTVTADIKGSGGVVLDAVLGATKPANVLQVGGNDGTNAYAVPLASGGTSVVVSGSVTTSGTATVSGTVTADIVGHAGAVLDGATGSAIPANALMVGGSDGTNLRAITTDTQGNQLINAVLPVVVQKNSGVTSVAAKTLAVAFSNSVKAGNTILACVGLGLFAASNFTVTLSDGVNTYYQDNTTSQSTTQAVYAFRAPNITAGATTITVTISGSNSANTGIALAIYEIANLANNGYGAFTLSSQLNSASGTQFWNNFQPTEPNQFALSITAAGTSQTLTAGKGYGVQWIIDYNLAPTGGNLAQFAVAEAIGSWSIPVAGNLWNNIGATIPVTAGGATAFATILLAYKPNTLSVGGSVEIQGNITAAALYNPGEGSTGSNFFGSGNTTNIVASGMYVASGANGTFGPQRTPAVFKGAFAQSGVTSVWYPTNTKKFRLMRYKLSLCEDVTYANAGTTIMMGFRQGLISTTGGTLPVMPTFLHRKFIPQTFLSTSGVAWDSDWIDLGNGFIAGTASVPLQLGINITQTTAAVTPTFTIAANQWEAATMGFKTAFNLGGFRLRQQTSNSAAAASVVLPSISVLANNAIIVAVRTTNIAAGAPTIAVTDTQGNSYTALAITTNGSDSANGSSLQLFYTLTMTSGNTTNAITVTTTVHAATEVQAIALEYDSLTAVGTTGQSSATGNSTSPSSGSYTPGEVGDLIITAFATQATLASQPTISGFALAGSIFTAAGAIAIADNFGNGTLATGAVETTICGTEE